MNHPDDLHNPDLQPVAERLRAERPELSPLALDATKRRVLAAAGGRRPARSAPTMKSRLAILFTLVAGMLLSTAGAGLAITGFSGSDDASIAQYPPQRPAVDVLPEQDDNAGDDDQDGNGNGGGGNGDDGNVGGEEDDGLQPTRQAEAGVDSGAGAGDELPFTGFAAIPILIGGVALLSTGVVLRRRSTES